MTINLGLSKSHVDRLCGISGEMYRHLYYDDKNARLSIGLFVSDLNEQMKKALKPSSSPKPLFYQFSGHDNTLGPLVNALQLEFDAPIHPAMGSGLLLEIWKDKNDGQHYFKYLYYEKETQLQPVKMKQCSDYLCPLSILQKRYAVLIPVDYEKECKI